MEAVRYIHPKHIYGILHLVHLLRASASGRPTKHKALSADTIDCKASPSSENPSDASRKSSRKSAAELCIRSFGSSPCSFWFPSRKPHPRIPRVADALTYQYNYHKANTMLFAPDAATLGTLNRGAGLRVCIPIPW
jgi:hypothetical protein